MVIGSGGREHTLVKKIKENQMVEEIFCAPGNGGIGADAVCVPIKATDIDGVLAFAQEKSIDFVVVAPDDPLALGMVDALENAGIAAFGPNKAAARIESSKVFAKRLMQKYKIPTARYESFENETEAIAYIRKQNRFPVVIKADGLALGKGVVIAQDEREAQLAVHGILGERIFGDSGSSIVVEQFLTGPEVSVLCFTDGKTLVPMVSSMDHKRALDNNQGPNTGGMGTIAPNPHYTPEMAERCMEEIFLPTIRAMQEEGCPFKGCLYFGLMLTAAGPMVIEYNCRFGDPETQVVLPLLETDLLTVMQAVREERLHELEMKWNAGTAACVVLASGGYPGKYTIGIPIAGLNEAGQVDGATVYHAGTRQEQGAYLTAGGRVLGITAVGETLFEALESAYNAARSIRFEGAHMRTDIGKY